MTLLRSPRASPLSDAVVPLLLEYGRDVTTKQIAESAGIAEGTLFRAFGDKESIIAAAVEKFLDPEPLRMMLRGIDPDDPIERQVHDLIFHLRTRFEGIFGIMAAVGMHGRPPGSDGRAELAELVIAVLSERPGALRVEASRAAALIRLLALASSIPPFTESAAFTTDELTDLVLHGILQTDLGKD
jgi:AcrR family transcriptional regulator